MGQSAGVVGRQFHFVMLVAGCFEPCGVTYLHLLCNVTSVCEDNNPAFPGMRWVILLGCLLPIVLVIRLGWSS